MGGAVSGITNAGSSILGGIGANKAAKQQISANNEAKDLWQQMYDKQMGLYQPFYDAGQSGLSGLLNLVNNRQGALNDYYNSGEYAGLANQARYQQLAGAEATGGLGSTATSNAMASIAPQLGQNYLNSQYGNLMGLTGLGFNSAGNMSQASGDYANAMAGLLTQGGQFKAGKAAIPWQTAASANSSMGNGAAQDLNSFGGMFSSFGGLF